MIQVMRMTYPKKRTSHDTPVSIAPPVAANNHKPRVLPPEKSYQTPGEHLGKDFSLIKLDGRRPLVGLASETETVLVGRGSGPTTQGNSVVQNTDSGSLPSWLAQTFATLPRKHPLRSLLSMNVNESSSLEAHPSSDSTAVDMVKSSPESKQLLLVLEADDTPTSPSTLISGSTCVNSGISEQKTRQYAPSPKELNYNQTIEHASEISALQIAHFKPFATPGPASAISRPLSPLPIAVTGLNINMFPSPKNPVHHDGAYVDRIVSVLPIGGEGDAWEREPHTYFVESTESGRHIPVCKGHPYLGHADLSRTPSASAHPVSNANRPVYFDSLDSPIEKCLSPDSSSEPFVLDVEELDFRWTRFDCTRISQNNAAEGPGDTLSAERGYILPVLSVDEETAQQKGLRSPSPDEDRFRFQAVLDETELRSPENAQAEKTRGAFAPTSSIYISPLSRATSSNHGPVAPSGL